MKALALLCILAATATAAPKKDAERAHKSKQHGASPVAGTRAARIVNLHNQWTDEWLAVDPAQKADGPTLDRFLRDHYTNRPHAGMDPRILGFLLAAAAHFHADVVQVVSGFRHPKYNLILRKKGHQVARDSQHTKGNACDFFIPGIPTRTLHKWAVAQKIGGVGLYLDSGFVHMDTGPVRYWSGE